MKDLKQGTWIKRYHRQDMRRIIILNIKRVVYLEGADTMLAQVASQDNKIMADSSVKSAKSIMG